LSTPVAIAANTTYVASYYAPNGHYAADSNYFITTGVNNGVLHALSDAAASGNGVFMYCGAGAFPTNNHNFTNFWVDVAFSTIPPTAAPTIVSESPLPNATGAASNPGAVTATFSIPVQPSTISFVLLDSNSNAVPGTFQYDGQSQTVTFTPAAPLAAFATYTATLSGAISFAGNMMSPVSWSFTTAGAFQIGGLSAS